MKKIIRYSVHGFAPQYQTYHMQDVNYHLHNFNISEYPKHLQYQTQKKHNELVIFYKEHYQDLKKGIWFFIDGYKNNQSLKHLTRKVPCWEAEFEEDVTLYDCNWERIVSIDDPIVEFGGCYLPKRELYKVHNIKRRIFKKDNT